MSWLGDIYNKTKKKFQDWETPIQQSVSSGLGSMYDSAKNSLNNVTQDVSNYVAPKVQSFEDNYVKPVESFVLKNPTPMSYVAPKIKDYFTNPASTPNWAKKIDSGMRNFSESKPQDFNSESNNPFKPKLSDMGSPLAPLARVANTKFNFGENAKTPLGKFAGGIADSVLNLPHETKDILKEGYGTDYVSTPEGRNKLLNRVGRAGKLGIDIGLLGAGGGAAKRAVVDGLAKPALKTAMIEGGKEMGGMALKAAPAYIGAKMLEANPGERIQAGIDEVPNQLMSVAAMTAMGAGAPVLGKGAKMAIDETKAFGKDLMNLPKSARTTVIPASVENVSKNIIDKRPGIGTFETNPATGKLEKTAGFDYGHNEGKFSYPEKKIVEPWNPQSKILNIRPGMSIEAVPGEKPNLDALIAEKQARAKALVNKQIDNQKVMSDTAEPGFVPPQTVQAPAKKELFPTIDEFVNGKSEAPVAPIKSEQKPLFPTMEEFLSGKVEAPKPEVGKTFSSAGEPVSNLGAKDKSMAKALGMSEKDIPVDNPFIDTPEYNWWQRDAYNKKSDRIKSIGEVMNEPKALRESGYRKAETLVMSPEEAKAKADLLNLGYPKNVVENLDLIKAQKLIEGGVQYSKMPPHIIDRYSQGDPAIPRYMNQDIVDTAGKSQYLAETEKQDFNNIFDKWIGERNAAKTSGMEMGAKYRNVPKDMGWNVIDSIEHPNENAPETVKYITGMIREQLDRIHQLSTDMGMKVGYWFDYFPHIWKESPEQIQEMIKGAGGKFKFANERDIPTYREGINAGLTPKYNHPAPVLAEYMQQLKKTEANLGFLRELKNKGFIVDATVAQGQSGFVPLNAPGFPKSTSMGPDGEKIIGEYYAPSDIGKIINRVFGTQDTGYLGKALNIGARASGVLQDITLSGGIPKTPFNAWTFAQSMKEALSGRFVSPTISAIRSMSGDFSNKFFEANSGQIKKMQLSGIPLETSWNLSNLMDEGFMKNTFTGTEPGIWNGIKSAWNKTVNEPTFKRFMPMLQINLFNDIERQAMKAGRSANEATQIATNAVKNFYGVQSAGDIARRTQIGKDATGALFFAPRYRESMINFWVNNIKAFRHPLALENRNNLKFLAGASVAYGAYDIINLALNGRHLKDNPAGNEDKLLIPLPDGHVIKVPFLPSIATMPRMAYRVANSLARGDVSGAAKDAVQSSVSMGIKPVADIAANSDYFGNEIYDPEKDTTGEKYGKMGKYLASQYILAHPYVKAIFNSDGKPGYQIAAEASELPLGFTTQDKLASGEFWDKKTASKIVYDKFRELAKNDKSKANDFYVQNKELIDEYPKLNDIAGMYSDLKNGGEKDQFGRVARDMGFGLFKPQVAEASSGNTPDISKDGMSNDAQKIIKDFEIKNKMAELEKSDGNFMDLGDTVLKKSEDGTVHRMRKDSYNLSLYATKLSNMERNKDFENWKKTAEEKNQLLNRMLLDPSVDEQDKEKIQGEIDILQNKFSKFKGYGGFTKGKKAAKTNPVSFYQNPDADPVMLAINRMRAFGKKPAKYRIKIGKSMPQFAQPRISQITRKSNRLISLG